MNLSSSPEPEIIIFGGTFDPPHRGHLDCLQFTKQNFPGAELFVIPSFLPPVVANEKGGPTASFEDRLEMCRLAFSPIVNPQNILDVEKLLVTPNYTVQTLRHFQKLFPNKTFGWLMGLDQLKQFHLWAEPLAILDLASLIVLPRDEGDFSRIVLELSRRLGIAIAQEDSNRVLLEGKRKIYLVRQATSQAASRNLRQRLKNAEELPKAFLPEDVRDYIHKRKLYGA